MIQSKIEAAYRQSDLFERRRRLMNDWPACSGRPLRYRRQRPARTPVGQRLLHAHDLQYLHQALVALAQRTEFLGQTREQPILECQRIL